MHLDRVLVFVGIEAHPPKLFPRFIDLFQYICVEGELPKRRTVVCTCGESAVVKINMVRGTKHKDSLTAPVACVSGHEALSREGGAGKRRGKNRRVQYALEISSDLYAHAAAGPEYE